MRVVLQRVSRATVRVESRECARIGGGLVALVAIEHGDSEATVAAAARRISQLRVFEDDQGKMNLDALQAAAEVLIVSQFTLAADLSRGRRPSFGPAAPPEVARPLVEALVEALRARGLTVECGVFGARMALELVNDGPVTFVLEFGESAAASSSPEAPDAPESA